MKYRNEITINANRDTVVKLFDNPENLVKWQPGFVAMEHISGEQGQVGAKYLMKYKMGKRDMELLETITERNLPDVFSGTYETKGIWNSIENHFQETEDGNTKYWTESEFKMRGMMKLMAWIMPGAFKKQSQKYLELFKKFVEEEVRGSEG